MGVGRIVCRAAKILYIVAIWHDDHEGQTLPSLALAFACSRLNNKLSCLDVVSVLCP